MAFVPGLSKSQVVKVIENYADLAPETMQLIDDLSAQINDPNDPAAALIARMTVAESDIDLNESSISVLSGIVSGKQDAVSGISSTEIGYLDGVTSAIQNQIDSKAPSASPTLSNPTLTGTVTLPNSSIANSKLVNSSISINGASVPLGGQVTVTGTALPSQTDNAGKALVTDGSSLSWETIDVSTLSNPTILLPQTDTTVISGPQDLGPMASVNTNLVLTFTEENDIVWISNSLPTGFFESGRYFADIISSFPGTPSELSLEIISFSLANQYPELTLAYDGGHFSTSQWPCNITIREKSADITITPTELKYLDGLTSPVQSQLMLDTFSVYSLLDGDYALLYLKLGGAAYYDLTSSGSPGSFAVYLYYDNAPMTTLDSAMEIGKSATFVIIVKNGSSPKYIGSIMGGIDTLGTVRWQGGTAPTSGNANATDVYTITALKTAEGTFEVFADVAKFA